MSEKSLIAVHQSLILIVSSLCLLLVIPVVSAESMDTTPELQGLQLVFTADYGKGEQVFYSSYKKNDWTIPVQISESKNFVFHPVSSMGSDGKKWTLWTQADKKGKFLYYSVFSNSRWSLAKKIDTRMNDNRAATLVVDNNNIPWIAWLGEEKKYTDVFWTRWNGSGWDSPVKAHADNKVPDVQPQLALDDSGHVRLSWQTFIDGKYVVVSKTWDEQQRRLEKLARPGKSITKKIKEQVQLPPLPAFIKEPHKATLFIKTTVGTESVPLIHF
jgi:hypothetical protein